MTQIAPQRVSNLMASRLALTNIARANSSLITTQQQIATGRSLLRPSDDIVKAATVSVLDDRLDRSRQLLRNFEHADAAISEIESTLTEATDLAQQARAIASSQVNLTSSASERAGQATVIDGLLQGLFAIANKKGVAGHVLGASNASQSPISQLLGGYRLMASGAGAFSDLGVATSAPLTLGENNPILRRSSTAPTVNLIPDLTADTRLADLYGARGLGVQPGTIRFAFGAGPSAEIDLRLADTAGDVTTLIERAIRDYENAHGVSILGGQGVGLSGGAIAFDMDPGAAAGSLRFEDTQNGVSSLDLGLRAQPNTGFGGGVTQGADLAPRLTWRTPISSVGNSGGPLGSIVISNAGRSATVDLSGATTFEELRNLIEGTNLGVRVRINDDGRSIRVENELAAGSANAMSIGEVDSGDTATRLGIRTLSGATRLSNFNFGQGVEIVDGVLDPVTGSVNTSLSADMRITLGDSASTRIEIDLRPQDIVSVQTLIERINEQAATQLAAAGLPPDSLRAELASDGNGISLAQSGTFTQALRVEPLNNSPAAEQLGLTSARYHPTTSTLVGEDRATIRSDSLFTYLVDLRDALLTNDVRAIGRASADLGTSLDEIAETRGVLGGHAQRIDSAKSREEDRSTLETTIRSTLADTDFASAATRFSLLQMQLEAGLRVTAMAGQRSLLDFLG
jgi:flagellin-like hook-associated protein FlgL